MPAPHENAHKFQVRYAPSFIAGDHSNGANGDQGRAYTGTALASFLGITKKSTTRRNSPRQSNPAFLYKRSARASVGKRLSHRDNNFPSVSFRLTARPHSIRDKGLAGDSVGSAIADPETGAPGVPGVYRGQHNEAKGCLFFHLC